MAGTNVQSLASNLFTVRLSSGDSGSKQQQRVSSESFSDVMSKTSGKSFQDVEKSGTKETAKADGDDIKTDKEFTKKLKELDEAIESGQEEVSKDYISQSIDELKEAIADKLNISVHELEAIMEQLNIQAYELFDTNTLAKLVASSNGFNNSKELLFDSGLMKDFKDIAAAMEEIKSELNAKGIEITKEGFISQASGEKLSVKGKNILESTQGADMQDAVLAENISNETDSLNEGTKLQSSDKSGSVNFQNDKGMAQSQESSSENTFFSNENLKDEKGTSGKHVILQGEEALTGVKANFFENIEQVLSDRTGKNQAVSIISQITEQVKLNVNSEFKSMEMQLYPEHLGKVGIQVVSRDGAVTATISAETEAVKRVLEAQLLTLKDNLNNQGLKVDNVEVVITSQNSMYGENTHEESSSDDKKDRKSRKAVQSILDDVGLSADMQQGEKEIMETLGNTVSYQA